VRPQAQAQSQSHVAKLCLPFFPVPLPPSDVVACFRVANLFRLRATSASSQRYCIQGNHRNFQLTTPLGKIILAENQKDSFLIVIILLNFDSPFFESSILRGVPCINFGRLASPSAFQFRGSTSSNWPNHLPFFNFRVLQFPTTTTSLPSGNTVCATDLEPVAHFHLSVAHQQHFLQSLRSLRS